MRLRLEASLRLIEGQGRDWRRLRMTEPLLSIEGLRTIFRTQGGDVAAVDGVDLAVARGRTLGIVGESGCGKSCFAVDHAPRAAARPHRAGRILFEGRDLLDLPPAAMRASAATGSR